MTKKTFCDTGAWESSELMMLMAVWCSTALEELCVQVPLAEAALEAVVMNTHTRSSLANCQK